MKSDENFCSSHGALTLRMWRRVQKRRRPCAVMLIWVKFLKISHGVGRDATPWAIFLADLNQTLQQILDRIYDSKYIFTYIINKFEICLVFAKIIVVLCLFTKYNIRVIGGVLCKKIEIRQLFPFIPGPIQL